MIKVDWVKDYHGDFVCPKCNQGTLLLRSIHNQIYRSFRCSVCKKETINAYILRGKHLKYRLEAYGLACPSDTCNARQMITQGFHNGKKVFKCNICQATALEFCDLSTINISKYSYTKRAVKPFNFQDNKWDLRSINPSCCEERSRYLSNFSGVKCSWLRLLSKQYIYHLCKLNTPYGTIENYLAAFRQFSDYLLEKKITGLVQIKRDLIIDFISWNNPSNWIARNRLISLNKLFITGNIKGWFQVDPDIIRNSDYPKEHRNNPDPIPDVVRKKIEKNLYKLPDPIARMWIICFFTAMRPYELALLKKDCLEQVGDKWKLVWWRKKGKKFHQHSVPISTTIVKVVQEQLEYIEELWGNDWEYLFCHYHYVSKSDPTHPKLEPVKKVIPTNGSPLQKAIRTLIKAEDIRDDNGELGKFQTRLVRETRLTELFLKGHDLSVVSAWAGHRQLATTANSYTQVTCKQIEKEVGHIQSALVNADGKKIYYESMPKSFWNNPVAHELEVAATHVNTPIYGYCGLDLDEECDKFRACYTCRFFVAKPEKLFQYVNLRDELRAKQERALANGHGVLVEQFARQADQLDKIILSLQEAA